MAGTVNENSSFTGDRVKIHTNPSTVLATLLVGYLRQVDLQDGSLTGSHKVVIEDYDGDLHTGTVPKTFIQPEAIPQLLGSEVILGHRSSEVLMPDGEWCFWDSLDTLYFITGPFQGMHHVSGMNSDKQHMHRQITA